MSIGPGQHEAGTDGERETHHACPQGGDMSWHGSRCQGDGGTELRRTDWSYQEARGPVDIPWVSSGSRRSQGGQLPGGRAEPACGPARHRGSRGKGGVLQKVSVLDDRSETCPMPAKLPRDRLIGKHTWFMSW